MPTHKNARYKIRESVESIDSHINSPPSVMSNRFGSRSKILRNSSSIKFAEVRGSMSRAIIDTNQISEIIDEKLQSLMNIF